MKKKRLLKNLVDKLTELIQTKWENSAVKLLSCIVSYNVHDNGLELCR